MNRRDALIGCSRAIAQMTGGKLTGLSFEDIEDSTKDIFVYVFLRGGCDGLSLVAPTDDDNYRAARSGDLSVTLKAGKYKGHEIKNPLSDVGFAFHPGVSGLSELYKNGDLAVVHATGLTNGTRSHFEAMDLIERGTKDDNKIKKGWITRFLESTGWSGNPVYSLGGISPASLQGYPNSASLNETKDFRMYWDSKFPELLKKIYAGDTLIHNAGTNALNALESVNKRIEKLPGGDFKEYVPDPKAVYPGAWPGNDLAKSFKSVAQLIKSDVGLKVATVDYGGWDHHQHQSWRFNSMASGLSQALHAFYNDLHEYHGRLTIVVMSEFGRRLKSNESRGTDHGYGNAMMILGGNVKGGKMYGKWPGLDVEQLDKGVDLAITTDYRTVLSEVLKKRMNTKNVSKIFPEFSSTQSLNIFK